MTNSTTTPHTAVLIPETQKTLHVHLLSPSVWRPLTEAAFALVNPQESRLAQATVTTFHNRHVGITPQLVATLAPLLLDPAQQARSAAPWDAVIARLLNELLTTDDTPNLPTNSRQRPRFGLLFHANPSYSALRIIMPIVLEACRQMGVCYLFCADEVPSTITKDGYNAYADALAQQISAIAVQRDALFQMFWQERSITLSTLSQQTMQTDASTLSLPEMDPAALRLLQQLNPELSTTRQAKKLPRLVTPLNRQRSLTRKEGGVDGIRVTRRMDDINNILMSEFMNHDLILADRILNTGYLAIERPPERVKLRDVLIAALLPADVQQGLQADFVKACWFDCLMHLSVLLRQHKLHKSEFRWIEGDAFDRVRSNVFALDKMPIFDVALEEQPNAGYRAEFLKALHWLPTYLDTRGPFQPLTAMQSNGHPAHATPPTLEQAQMRTEQLQQWLKAVWRTQAESRAGPSQQSSAPETIHRKNRLAVNEFAYVHVMLFLPAHQRKATFAGFSARSGQLLRLLELDGSPNHHVSITWVPDRLVPNHDPDGDVPPTTAATIADADEAPSNRWLFEARGRQPMPLLAGTRADHTGKGIAGSLEQAWLEQLLKEMWRG